MSNFEELLNSLPEEGQDIGNPENWTEPSEFPPPPPAGEYTVSVEQVRDVKVIQWPNQKVTELTLDFKVQGGDYDGRLLNFMRINSAKRDDNQSAVLDLFKLTDVDEDDIAEIAYSGARKIAEIAKSLADQKKLVNVVIDWQGFSVEAFKAKLSELTGEDDYEDAKKEATKEQKKEANKYANVAPHYKNFPDSPNGEGKQARLKGPLGETVQARATIRVFKPVE